LSLFIYSRAFFLLSFALFLWPNPNPNPTRPFRFPDMLFPPSTNVSLTLSFLQPTVQYIPRRDVHGAATSHANPNVNERCPECSTHVTSFFSSGEAPQTAPTACSFGRWLVAGADLFREKSTFG
jgi:hypothetical protein